LGTSQTYLHQADGFVFLHSRRFDRHGEHGRSPVISLAAIDAEFTGFGSDWAAIARALHQQGLLEQSGLNAMLSAYCFGRWIANTDMHLGNFSLIPTADGFQPAPVYDMTPMFYKPVNEYIPADNFPLPDCQFDDAIKSPAMQAAKAFWQQMTEEPAVADEFREIAERAVVSMQGD
jgi:serine/threonine protein kinase HipA of HipAB toxin-antitoxin module